MYPGLINFNGYNMYYDDQLIKAWCPLKGHTYLDKPAAHLQICLSMTF